MVRLRLIGKQPQSIVPKPFVDVLKDFARAWGTIEYK